jgi:hypothetical protein
MTDRLQKKIYCPWSSAEFLKKAPGDSKMGMQQDIKEKIIENRIAWRGHALKRMMERDLSREAVKTAIQDCIIVEEYPDDFPFPSFLLLGYYKNEPLHIVCSINQNHLWIITAYRPDKSKWEEDLKTRRR